MYELNWENYYLHNEYLLQGILTTLVIRTECNFFINCSTVYGNNNNCKYKKLNENIIFIILIRKKNEWCMSYMVNKLAIKASGRVVKHKWRWEISGIKPIKCVSDISRSESSQSLASTYDVWVDKKAKRNNCRIRRLWKIIAFDGEFYLDFIWYSEGLALSNLHESVLIVQWYKHSNQLWRAHRQQRMASMYRNLLLKLRTWIKQACGSLLLQHSQLVQWNLHFQCFGFWTCRPSKTALQLLHQQHLGIQQNRTACKILSEKISQWLLHQALQLESLDYQQLLQKYITSSYDKISKNIIIKELIHHLMAAHVGQSS